MYVNRREL